jgi:HEAT repeat protein
MKRIASLSLMTLLAAAPAAAGELETWKAQVAEADDARAEEAALKLAGSTDPRSLDVLLDALAVGGSPKVQGTLLGALGNKKDPRALEVLKHFAKNRNPELRKKAVAALGELAGEEGRRAVPALLEALADPAPEVRGTAAEALGKRKERQAETRLLKLLAHGDEPAARALAQLATPDLAHRITELLGTISDALLCTAIGDMLKRGDFGPDPIRLELIKTLNKVPGVDSTTTLVEYLSATEKDKMRPSRIEAQKILDQRSGQ